MEALEAFDELELDIGCFGAAQVKEKISNYCLKFAIAEVYLRDEEIQCKEDFALFIAHNCFWENLRITDFSSTGSTDQTFEFFRTVVDHLKLLLQPPVGWHKSKTLFALARAFRQMSEQSDILSFHAAGCFQVRAKCGAVVRVVVIQTGISLARKMREDMIQVAKKALRTQQFKTANDDLSAAIKDFKHKIRKWFDSAERADEQAIKPAGHCSESKQGEKMICQHCCKTDRYGGVCHREQCFCRLIPELWHSVPRRFMRPVHFDEFVLHVQHFSEYTTQSQSLLHATSKLLDLSLASELQISDSLPDISTTSLSSWSMVDVADQDKTLEDEVESIASYNSVDSQTSCLSASGGPHCFLPTCRFKCVEDETSLVREVLGKDAKLLKQVSLETKIHLWLWN